MNMEVLIFLAVLIALAVKAMAEIYWKNEDE